MNNRINVIAIVGATASGKTAYSIELAKKLDGEIISADSRLVYKGFDIGTAKPEITERENIPHHLIDIVEPEFDYSAGLYKQQAKEKIIEIFKKGKTPIIVGGTGLYLDILLKNYDLPQISPNKEFRNKLYTLESQELYELLKTQDIESAETINQNDRKKIIRALEIIKETGKPLNSTRGIKEPEFNVKWIGRNFDRETLYKRIDDRIDEMLKEGLLEEVQKLKDMGYHRGMVSMQGLGYKEILAYLDGEYPLEEAVRILKRDTRHFAKRQLTWFRREKDAIWMNKDEFDYNEDRILDEMLKVCRDRGIL